MMMVMKMTWVCQEDNGGEDEAKDFHASKFQKSAKVFFKVCKSIRDINLLFPVATHLVTYGCVLN